MTKKIISDMIITKRSIRQIPIPLEKKQKLEKEIKEVENHQRQRKPLNPKFLLWSIAGICLLALFFGLSLVFSSVTVFVIPRTEQINFNNESYTVKSASVGTADLSFEILKINQTAGEVVLATKEKEISRKATGKILIYNNYSTVSQRLISNTRFEANNGKIYKINSSVVVPGLKKVDGKVVPGSVEATVFADQAGEAYNLKLADLAGDFKIPGFKGDPRYTGFYARLKTDIVGGFVGVQRIVDDTLRKDTEEILKLKLKELLLKELYALKPENYLIFKDGYSVEYNVLTDTAVDSDKVQINIEGVLNGIVFNNLKLSKYLATKKIEKFDGLPTELVLTDNLTAVLTGADSTGLWKNDTLQLKLNGQTTIKWLYDIDAIKKDLAGKKESDLKNILFKYKDSIKSLQIVFKPVWTRYFPDNTDKINFKETSPSV